MKHRLPAYLLIVILSWQLFSLPLTYAWFYANRAEIAAKHCVNLEEPIPMCYGKCYLTDVVAAQLPSEANEPGPSAPANRGNLSFLPPALLPDTFTEPERPAELKQLMAATNYWYELRHDRGFSPGCDPPPWVG